MPRADPGIARHVDALDIDGGRDLPVDARLPRRHQLHRTAIEADDGDFVRLRLHQLRTAPRPDRAAPPSARRSAPPGIRREPRLNTSTASARRGSNRRCRPGSSTRSSLPLRVTKARSPSFTVTCNINRCRVMTRLHRWRSGTTVGKRASFQESRGRERGFLKDRRAVA